jgi:colicin import membrane protein
VNYNGDMKTGDHVEECVFPTGPHGQQCGRPVAAHGKPVSGRRPLYCDNPEHTRGKAFAARRRYELAAARGHDSNQPGAVQVDQAVPEHPVTDGRVSFGALLARFEESSTRLVTILNRAIEVVRTVSDPDAASYEVEQKQREAAIQVAQAHSAQAAAEHVASNARKQVAHEAEQRAQADEAADHALHEVQQMQVKLADALSARDRAEAEKESAHQAAQHDRATIQSLQQQLEQQRDDHRHDLDTLRQQAQDERATLAKQYTDQIATILATIQQASHPTQTKPATTPRAQHNHPPRTKKQQDQQTQP